MSKFFSLGQVIETVRGGGVFQPAIDDAIKKLGQGEWVCRAMSVGLRADQVYTGTPLSGRQG
jgi:hypothetical protein